MKRRHSGHSFHSIAPAVLGAICLLLGALISACDDPPADPPPPPEQAPPPAAGHESAAGETAPAAESFAPVEETPLAAPPAASRLGGRPRGPAPAAADPAAAPDAPAALRFVSFNLKNWLTMERYSDGRKLPDRPKPGEEKAAVVATIAAASPDVLGVCEIGTRDDLENLQAMLAEAGCPLPHAHHAGGEDDTRHLGLLSRLPITATGEPADDDYELGGRTFRIQRGILDATVETGARRYRFLGVHFKSKREVEEADQEEMRRNEAHLMRLHIDSILMADPQARLVAYGDMNDTRRSSAVRAVQGAYNTPDYLTAVRAADSHGHVWTHHWEYQDVYSRFDYVLVNRAARAEVDFEASRILDPENWDEASDHRAVLVIFR